MKEWERTAEDDEFRRKLEQFVIDNGGDLRRDAIALHMIDIAVCMATGHLVAAGGSKDTLVKWWRDMSETFRDHRIEPMYDHLLEEYEKG